MSRWDGRVMFWPSIITPYVIAIIAIPKLTSDVICLSLIISMLAILSSIALVIVRKFT